MDRRRKDALERQIRQKVVKHDSPAPGFFKAGDPLIDTYRENLLRQGFTLEAVNRTPIYIEEFKEVDIKSFQGPARGYFPRMRQE